MTGPDFLKQCANISRVIFVLHELFEVVLGHPNTEEGRPGMQLSLWPATLISQYVRRRIGQSEIWESGRKYPDIDDLGSGMLSFPIRLKC